MPPKRTAKTADATKCDLCAAAIIDGKEDALQCEGTCQKWFHRYCAGISLSHFQELASSAKPFVCLSCSQNVHQAVVCQLQAEISALKAEVRELRAALEEDARVNASGTDATTSLVHEVQQLKAAMNDILQQNEQTESKDNRPSSEVVRRGRQRPGQHG